MADETKEVMTLKDGEIITDGIILVGNDIYKTSKEDLEKLTELIKNSGIKFTKV